MEICSNVSSGRRFCFALALITFFAFGAKGQSLKVRSADYPTNGNPTSALETADGRHVFVTVTNVGAPNFTGPDSAAGTRKDVVSGVQIFRERGDKLEAAGFIKLGSTGANGLALLPDGKTLVIGVGDAGVAFLDVADAIRGTARPVFASQGDMAGTFDVVVTPDGKYVFSSNEYGVFEGQRGNVGITAVHADAEGRVLHPETIGHIALGDIVPGLTLSPDGSRLYVATELVPAKGSLRIAGKDNPALTKDDCVQKKGTPARSNGFITVIDVHRAVSATGGQDGILSRVAAGCSPVRLVETTDASAIFVSSRGDNAVLQFDPRRLESDPDNAFRRSLPSGGEAPVGVRLFHQDRLLAVANSNRFGDSPGKLAIIEVLGLNGSTLLQSIPAGVFPRNISSSRSGQVLILTNYTSRTIEKVSFESAR